MSNSENSTEAEVPEIVEPELLEPLSVPPREPPSTDLEVRPPGNEVLMPLDTKQVIEGMRVYQQLLQDLLDPSDWQEFTERGEKKKFAKKSAWRKIARAFNLSVMVVSVRIERDAEGNPTRAETIARAMAPNGQVSDADGYCSADEKRFQSAGGKQKLENDLRATATTRAKNRAISDLVGMGEVSAEEVEQGGGATLQFPLATTEQKAELRTCLEYLFPPDEAKPLWGQIKQLFGGELYGPAADAVCGIIRAHKANLLHWGVDFERREAEEAAAERDAADG